jgi:hypothetical protein
MRIARVQTGSDDGFISRKWRYVHNTNRKWLGACWLTGSDDEHVYLAEVTISDDEDGEDAFQRADETC